jgi:hypothetical protein
MSDKLNLQDRTCCRLRKKSFLRIRRCQNRSLHRLETFQHTKGFRRMSQKKFSLRQPTFAGLTKTKMCPPHWHFRFRAPPSLFYAPKYISVALKMSSDEDPGGSGLRKRRESLSSRQPHSPTSASSQDPQDESRSSLTSSSQLRRSLFSSRGPKNDSDATPSKRINSSNDPGHGTIIEID